MIRWYALAALVLAADQVTKLWVLAVLERGVSVPVLPFLSWTHACNSGVAFSMFRGYGWVFAPVAVAVSGYLAWEIWRLRQRQPTPMAQLEGAAYGLVMAGALGNVLDRWTQGCVVDFVHVHYGWFNFPVFNVADSAVTVGAAAWIGLLVVQMIDERRRRAA